MRIKGVDLSYCQKGIDYGKLKAAGAEFAVIRAGFARTEDRLLEAHVNGCLAAGLNIGYYWYSYARSADEARREAAACVKAVSRFPAPKLPVFFDAEEDGIAASAGRAGMTDMALEFMSEVEKGGYPAGLYVNPAWLENRYEKQRLLTSDIWLAHWTGSDSIPSRYDYGQVMWQWGTVKAGGLDVDADICFIDYPARVAEWYAKRRAEALPCTGARLDETAREVIAGKWGNGAERKRRLAEAGFDYRAVQARVNELLKR